MNIVPSELNRRLAQALQYSISADRSYIKGKSAFWRLVGIGLVGFAVGVGTGLAFYGYSQILQRSTAEDVLASAFSDALSKIALKASAEGTVNVEPRDISLAKDQIVTLDGSSRVYLDPDAKVVANGEMTVLPPSISAPAQSPRSAPKIPAIANFTVFKSVQFDKGYIKTGWVFLTSAQKYPTSQYCYYNEVLESAGFDVAVFIGTDEKIERPKTLPKNFDLESAFTRCIWFKRS